METIIIKIACALIFALATYLMIALRQVPLGLDATTFTDLSAQSEVYAAYMEAMLPEKMVMVQSGVATINGVGIDLGAMRGKTVAVPRYEELSGDEQVLAAATNLTINPIGTYKDVGVVCARGKAWGAEDFAAILAGADPMREISRQSSNYWGRKFDTALIKVASGALAACGATHQLDKSGANFDFTFIIEAADKLSDNQDELSIIGLHGRTYSLAQKLGLVTYPTVVPAPGAGPYVLAGGFIGRRRVVVSDQFPVAANVYSTFLFGSGAMTLVYQKALKLEAERQALLAGGTDILVTTAHFIPHLYEVAWQGMPAGATPTNTELATSGNWTKVADNDKNIRAVEIKHLASLT